MILHMETLYLTKQIDELRRELAAADGRATRAFHQASCDVQLAVALEERIKQLLATRVRGEAPPHGA